MCEISRQKDGMGVIVTFQQRIDRMDAHEVIPKVTNLLGSGLTSQFLYHLLLMTIMTLDHDDYHNNNSDDDLSFHFIFGPVEA